jgi:hypothetical protein
MNVLKLRSLIENIEQIVPVEKREWTNEEKKAALEAIGRYNEYGGQLRREYSLMEIASTLAKITESAERFATKEMTESNEQGWFDAHTVKENFKRLRKVGEEFNKLATDAHTLQQRMEALYEDGGYLLERYFEIKDLSEGVAPAVSKIVKHQ